MVHFVSLGVKASVGNRSQFLQILTISEGDYLWNTLVADRSNNDDVIDLLPCIKFLKNEAEFFCSQVSDVLVFKSEKKADQFSRKYIKTPRILRNNNENPKYPGT